ncbi:MAG: hypothetical protein KatS3mg003_2391 [Candidatus Nitrosocaldaceae archaeon]|nr:MAG: hypothetical protein KatS3mg003_2391 [Candidatus Nitrosocaldaceae archaeon]
MVRRKKRYILIYSNTRLNKDKCRELKINLIERDHPYAIIRCYLSDLDDVRDRLKKEGIVTLNMSGTLKALRERKRLIINQ